MAAEKDLKSIEAYSLEYKLLVKPTLSDEGASEGRREEVSKMTSYVEASSEGALKKDGTLMSRRSSATPSRGASREEDTASMNHGNDEEEQYKYLYEADVSVSQLKKQSKVSS